jgi:uncharacterized protein (TIGR02452 family)
MPDQSVGLQILPNFEYTLITVEDSGTLGASFKLYKEGYNVVALNFASAKNPGGGFLGGSEA